jgi:hypothetical protein
LRSLCRAVGGGLRSGSALVDVRLDVVHLPPRYSSPTVAGCRLGRYPGGSDRWGGERVVGGVLSRINIGADVWGESSIMTGAYHMAHMYPPPHMTHVLVCIMTGAYQRRCSSTLHIGWGLCDCLCRTILLFVGPSYFFISLVLGPLNSLVWYVPSLKYTRGLGWRIHCVVEVTESSTNKQHHFSSKFCREHILDTDKKQ